MPLYANNYCRVPSVRSKTNSEGVSADDAAILTAIDEASEFARSWFGRIFHTEIGTSLFNGNGLKTLYLADGAVQPYRSDLLSVTELTEDGVVLVEGTDFYIWPASPSTSGQPARRIDRINGAWSRAAERNISISGRWGHSERWENSLLTVNEGDTDGDGVDASETEITLSATAENKLYVGDTIQIGSEQMYVLAVDTVMLTVERAVNGTTAATHADATAIYVRRYPADLERAVASDAARYLWKSMSGYPVEGSNFREGWAAIKDTLNHYRIGWT